MLSPYQELETMVDLDYAQAVTCALLSRDIYEDFASPRLNGFEKTHPYYLLDDPSTDTQGAVIVDSDAPTIHIVFRGSSHEKDWDINRSFSPTVAEFKQEVIQGEIVEEQEKTYPYAEGSSSGAMMHSGFVKAYMAEKVRPAIHQYLNDHITAAPPRVIVTGHSLGGAIATLCAVDIQYNFESKISSIELYSFGAPRVGNRNFQDSFNRRVPQSYRFIYGMDMVPALPRPWQGYVHTDQEYRLGSRFGWQFLSRRFTDHKIDNYIEALRSKLSKS